MKQSINDLYTDPIPEGQDYYAREGIMPAPGLPGNPGFKVTKKADKINRYRKQKVLPQGIPDAYINDRNLQSTDLDTGNIFGDTPADTDRKVNLINKFYYNTAGGLVKKDKFDSFIKKYNETTGQSIKPDIIQYLDGKELMEFNKLIQLNLTNGKSKDI